MLEETERLARGLTLMKNVKEPVVLGKPKRALILLSLHTIYNSSVHVTAALAHSFSRQKRASTFPKMFELCKTLF
jgi:hypothetical protein